MATTQLSLASSRPSPTSKSGADQLTKAMAPWVLMVVGYAAAAGIICLLLALLALAISLIRQVLATQEAGIINMVSISSSALVVPICAVAALALVTYFDLIRGRAEIEGVTVKLKGSTNSVLMWLIVFMAFTVANALLSR